MTVALVRGQNTALSCSRVVVRTTAAVPLQPAALLLDDTGRARSSAHLVHAGHPASVGVTCTPGEITVDLDALPAPVTAVLCLAVAEQELGATAPPVARVHGADPGTPLAELVLTGLSTERAVVTVELYRRGGGWKVRAVGQGYDGGLAHAAREHGVELTSAPVAPPAALADEQVARRIRAVWEDAARSTAAYVSAGEFAEARRDAEVSAALADPRQRTSAATEQARRAADARHDELLARADAVHERDIAQLVAELAGLEPALPAPVARWSAPAWRAWRPVSRLAPAIRLGTVHADLAPQLQVPLLAALPLGAPLWVDSTGGAPQTVARAVRALVVRLLAAHPAGGLRLQLVDLDGGLGASLGSAPQGPAGLAAVLDELVARVDLVQLAVRAGGGLDDTAGRLLVLHGLPYGLDETMLLRLRSIVQHGPAAGVHLLVTGAREDLLGRDADRVLAALAEGMQRVPVTSDGTVLDPWVRQEWVFTPDLGPDDPVAAAALLRAVAGTA